MQLIKTPIQVTEEKVRSNNLVDCISDTLSNLKQKTAYLKKKISKICGKLDAVPTIITNVAQKTSEAITNLTTDADKVYVITLLGGDNLAKNFYKEKLQPLNISAKDIRKFIDRLMDTDLLVMEDLLKSELSDIKTLYELSTLGSIRHKDMFQIHGCLSSETIHRMGYWLETVYKQDLMLVAIASPSSDNISDDNFEAILKHYVREAGKEQNKKKMVIISLLKVAFVLTSGLPLPKNSTVRMAAIWYMMIVSILEQEKFRNNGNTTSTGMATILSFELMAHLCTYAVKTTVDFIGSLLNYALDDFNGIKNECTEQEQRKYHCWNKTLSVLTDIAPLSKAQAGRMLLTYALAVNIRETLEMNIDWGTAMQRLAPLPDRETVYDLINFYRDETEYERRKKEIWIVMDVEIEKCKDMDERCRISYKTYYLLLKLKIAFCPNNFCKGSEGCFIDPTDLDIDSEIMNEVCNRQYIKGSNYIFDRYNLMKYKTKLREIILNDPTQEYMDFFGKPKNRFLGIGRKVKYYNELKAKKKKRKWIIFGSAILAAILGREVVEEYLDDVVTDETPVDLTDIDSAHSNPSAINEPQMGRNDWEEEVKPTEESYPVSFQGRNLKSIETDIENCNKKIENAKQTINTYSKELEKNNTSDYYKSCCKAKIKDAQNTIKDMNWKLGCLERELKNVKRQ